MNAEILVEPFEMKLGFRELEFFNKLNEQAQAFLVVLSGGSQDDLDITRETDADLERQLQKFKREDLLEVQKEFGNLQKPRHDHAEIKK